MHNDRKEANDTLKEMVFISIMKDNYKKDRTYTRKDRASTSITKEDST